MEIYYNYPDSKNDKKVVALWAYGGSADFNAQKPEFEQLKDTLTNDGITVVSFDYTGWDKNAQRHNFSEQSLNSRYRDLLYVSVQVRQRFPDYKIINVGNSMGGSLVAMLADEAFADGIVLIAPASYCSRLWGLYMASFAFKNLLRLDGSWKDAYEPHFLRRFEGSKLLIISSNDEVTTREITDTYKKEGGINIPEVVLCGPGEHKIFPHKEKRDEVAREIVSFVDAYIL